VNTPVTPRRVLFRPAGHQPGDAPDRKQPGHLARSLVAKFAVKALGESANQEEQPNEYRGR
jgi:hypothetical protein